MKKDTKLPIFNQYETVSPATKLLQKRRKMYEVHEAFQQQKQKFKDSQKSFKDKQQDIKKKDKDLQNDLQKFCQFLQQNQSKRKKAQQKYRTQEKQYQQKQRQLRILQGQITELNKNQKKYLGRVSYLRKYEDFLQKVRSSYSDQYPQMSDILTRYQTLKKSTEDLIRNREKMESNHEALRKDSLLYEKQMNQFILTLNNELKQLSRKIEDKIQQKNEVQSEVQRSNEQYSNKNLNLGKIFMAIDNLFYRANENTFRLKYEFDEKGSLQRKQPKNKKESTDQINKSDPDSAYDQRSKHATNKLKGILSHMRDLKTIIDEYKLSYKHKEKQQKN